MKSYFKKEGKFLLVWLLGFPLFLIAVTLIAGSFITHRHWLVGSSHNPWQRGLNFK